MVPLLLLGGYSYYSSLEFVSKQIRQELNNAVARVNLEIETKLYQCESTLSFVVNNYSFQDFLLPSETRTPLETTQIADMYIGPFLYNAYLSNSYTDKLEIYTFNKLPVLSALIKPSAAVQEKDWYAEILNSSAYYWWTEDSHLYVGKRIQNSITRETLGLARMRIKDELFTDSYHSFINPPSQIKISLHGSPEVNVYPENSIKTSYSYTGLLAPLKWEVTYYFSKENLASFPYRQFLLNLSVIVICLIMVTALIHVLSRSLMKRIFVLAHQMKKVRQGTLDIQIDTTYKDEIGILAQSFQAMISQLNFFIEDRYINELHRKELEFRILQEKINPHFLYNILSSINWIAIENNQPKISKITNNLATFYRTALNQGKDISTLRIELENIKSYISLQQIARDDPFEMEYDVSPILLDQLVPNFILQPLVENAFEHGINTLRGPIGRITIQTEDLDNYYHIKIIDNGTELFHKYGEGFLDESHYGYGLQNIKERIRLKIGADSSLHIQIGSQHTAAIITLPFNN
ncbi:sensor histidine kinase [Paenibacillus sp. FSL L8-0463]|uniref:sensor histidine kinase n=1 Tax=Paenibacillus sp. FSL L8-0463 TaxID=2954687 RepID=UPI00311971E9